MRASVIVQAIDDEIQALGGASIADTPNFVIDMMVDYYHQTAWEETEAAFRRYALLELLAARQQANVDPLHNLLRPIPPMPELDLSELFPKKP